MPVVGFSVTSRGARGAKGVSWGGFFSQIWGCYNHDHAKSQISRPTLKISKGISKVRGFLASGTVPFSRNGFFSRGGGMLWENATIIPLGLRN